MIRAQLVKLGRATGSSIVAATRYGAVSRFSQSISRSTSRLAPYRPILSRSFSCSASVANSSSSTPVKPAPITQNEYHKLADKYLDIVLTKYEEKQDEIGDIDVEFSSGVMTVKIPDVGVYIINKQPPNKQIWLASPVSGPKRFDYVVVNDGQGDEQNTGKGEWVYLRDGQKLSELLELETGVVLDDTVQ
ncbi:Frataxin [Jackrogersella minutella]|nr:Frataxin [Jackrogersella minutella]